MLMIAERMTLNPKEKEMIEKMGGELTNVIEDFMLAVDVQALCSAKRSGKLSVFSIWRSFLSSFT